MSVNAVNSTGSTKTDPPHRWSRLSWPVRLDLAVALIAIVTFLGSLLANIFYFSGLADYVNSWRESAIREELSGIWEATTKVKANEQGYTSPLEIELHIVNGRMEGKIHYPSGGILEITEDRLQGDEIVLIGYEHVQGVQSFQYSVTGTPGQSMTLENTVAQTVITAKVRGKELVIHERYDDGSESYVAVKK